MKKVAELFPRSDILFLSAMSDKALFHRPGALVIKNENGGYESIEDKVAEIDTEIEDKQSRLMTLTQRKALEVTSRVCKRKRKN